MSAPSPTIAPPAHGLTELLEELVRTPDGPAANAWAHSLRPGERIGRYEILRELGRGGFGAVYEALDHELQRRVALKTIRPGRSRDELATEELRREAQAAARLSHPGIVTLFEACTCHEGPYLVMELLRGETLHDRLQRGLVPIREAVDICLQIARALAYVHAQDLVHRDVKPANLFLAEDGRVRLLDLGLAHLLGGVHTASGGTPAYVAPEQWRGDAVDGRADVFAVGVVLYEMLAGRRPFSVTEGRSAVLDAARAPTLLGKVPRRLAALVERCLRPDARERPTAAQLAEGLLEIQRSLGSARGIPRSTLVGALAGVVLALAVAGVLAWRARQPVTLPVGPDGRVVVAVADFVNDTRDPDLDGLSGLLITSLEQSHRLRVMTRVRMIDLLRQTGRGDAERIDERLARDIGRSAGVRALLLASIRRLGSAYVAELRAIDPQRDEYLFTLQEKAGSKDEVLSLVDRLSERARTALREPEAEVRASDLDLARAVTPSLEAYRHYFRGQERAARLDTEGAIEEFRRAVAIEPRFALAQYELAFQSMIMASRNRELVDEALRNATVAPEKEARLIRALHALLTQRYEEIPGHARALLSLYPDDVDALYLSQWMFGFGGDLSAVQTVLDRVLALRPDFHAARLDQLWTLQALGRAGDARTTVAALVARERSPATLLLSAVARGLSGDVEGEIEDLRGATGTGAWGVFFRSQALAATGRTAEALRSIGDGTDHVSSIQRAMVFAYAGRLRDAREQLESAARQPDADERMLRKGVALFLAGAGRTDAARRIGAQDSIFQLNDLLLHFETGDDDRLRSIAGRLDASTYGGRLGRALVAWREGRRAEALEALRALDAPAGWFVPYYRGIAAAEAGNHEEAAASLGRFVPALLFGADVPLHAWLQARARIALARSLTALGRIDEARAIAETQRRMWRDADRDLPIARDLASICRDLRCRSAP